MYYPYLRGKQFELLALREFAASVSGNACEVCPIIEPVKASLNGINLAIRKFKMFNFKYAIVLNPAIGELVGKSVDIYNSLEPELNGSSWVPALIITNDNLTQINSLIEEFHLQSVILICRGSIDADSSDLRDLLLKDEIASVVIEQDDRLLIRAIRTANKKIIRIDDKFKPQKRNSDYLQISEEKFSEEHFFYREDRFDGFSDYSVLPKDFIEGGMLPYAVAIHLTYKKNNEQIWLKHFVSDTNDDRSNIQGKFAEAASKAKSFFVGQSFQSEGLQELINYFDNGQFPGLGVLKKVSIKHHIELVNYLLTRS